MSLRKTVKSVLKERFLSEGFTQEGSPDMKYYAFDWDDNIVTMPTQIVVLTDKEEEIGMSTEDFAEHRNDIGKKPFEYKGKMIIGYAPNPYRHFTEQGDKNFIVDAMLAKLGPSWDDFREAVNGGSIFSIITARGHNPETLKQGVYNYIINGFGGINKEELVRNLKRYREFANEDTISDEEIIQQYLEFLKFYPVTYGEGSAASPEEGKIKALREFIDYVRNMSEKLGQGKVFFKNDVKNKFVPQIGFSDDDSSNIEAIKSFLKKEYGKENPVKTYLTKGGEKIEV
jgi:hypothetical protein